MPHKNGKKILGVPPMGSEPCLSEPKLGNVATALQGDSLTLRANLTVPICTWNGVLIQSVMLLWKMVYEKNERPCLSYIVFSKSIVKCFPKQNDLPGIKIRTLAGLLLLDAS